MNSFFLLVGIIKMTSKVMLMCMVAMVGAWPDRTRGVTTQDETGISAWTRTSKFAGFTSGLVGLYWGVSQFHSNYCAPSGLAGLFQTAILMGSPACLIAVEVIAKTGEVYTALWYGTLATGASLMWDMCVKLGGMGSPVRKRV